ncbi:MAG: methylenetetrahydrofolate--tRNA-(uracil(54)-C(5))-methyltransferase (FADH(2)-oxidizing) TrmFO [bacterium]
MNPQRPAIQVVGGGLAGCEAALQLARFGLSVVLHEMRPATASPAHRSGDLAELVCSNSLKSEDPATASGLLKQELDLLGCRLLALARQHAVPAGTALAVDRERFAEHVTELVASDPRITVERGELTKLSAERDQSAGYWLLATGPLTSPPLQQTIGRLAGAEGLFFSDAIAPSVTRESLDLDILYRASRYDKGSADYLNAPLDESTYRRFTSELVAAEKAQLHRVDRRELFAGCQPIEAIAASGPDSLAFGPLRPVGLIDPRSGERPYAVLQLRQENRDGSIYGLVGFQTQLKHGEQRRIFRMIPGLAAAEFVRLGQLHRNFYLDSPRLLDHRFALRSAPWIRLAGQMTGVEGYVESIASGLVTAWLLAAEIHQIQLPPWPATGIIGALLFDFLSDTTSRHFTPMNANFGLLPPLLHKVRGKREGKLAKAERGRLDTERFLAAPSVRRLLAAVPS